MIGEQQFNLLFGFVRLLAGSFTLFAIKVFEPPQNRDYGALSTEVLNAKRLYLIG
jgi:hypothetical protein